MDSGHTEERLRLSRPAGGYRLIAAKQLAKLWWAHRLKLISPAGFRAWAAAQECVARRCQLGEGQKPTYTMLELQNLTGLSEKRLKEAMKRLENAGILRWGQNQIQFGDESEKGPDFQAFFEAIPNRKRLVPVPRRILRLIAKGARPALVAAILGHLLRCLYVKDSHCDGRGRCKASWIAETFGVDLRRVKDARRELVTMGWLVPIKDDPQWAMNRWGRAFQIDLDWGDRDEARETTKTPLTAVFRTKSTPPGSTNEEPLPRLENQKPAAGGSAGIKIEGRGGEPSTAPDLRHIVPEDLQDTARLLALRDQAVARGLIGGSESASFQFVAAAEHAKAVGSKNPPGLFAHLIRRGLWGYLTDSDEESASLRLRRHREIPSPRSPEPRPAIPSLSDDALIVRSVRSAAKAAGYKGDAYPLLRRERSDWTRERWDRAVLELESPGLFSSSIPAGIGANSAGLLGLRPGSA